MTVRTWHLVATLAVAMTVGSTPVGGTVMGVPAVQAATFETGRQPDSRIERPMNDVMFLDPEADSSVPRLLVIDAGRPTPGAVRMAVLGRDRSWSERAALEVALRPSDGGAVRPEWALEAPWMLPLDPRSVVVLANAEVEDAAYVAQVAVESGDGGDRLVQGAGVRIPFHVDDAAIADVDGDGRPSLVIASARTERGGGTCQDTTILVLDPVSLATQATLRLAGWRIAGAVVGRFDDVPGDDLFGYAYPNCPASPDTAVEARALAVSLQDGSIVYQGRAATVTGFLGTPLRVDTVDGDHAVVARMADGLALLEPGDPWRVTTVAPSTARPLAALSMMPGGAFVTWLDPRAGEQAIRTASVLDGTVDIAAYSPEPDPGRWQQLNDSFDENVRTGVPPVAFLGDIAGVGCPVLFVAGAIVPCGESTPGSGAAWTATRPLAVIDDGRSRRMLVAAGVGWQEGRLPGVPAPAATEVAGWWRHGPSTPFVLAEARAADATYFRTFPVPVATVERVSGPEGTVDLPGFTGTRLLVRVTAAAPDATEPSAPSRDDLLSALAGADEHVVVSRVQVPPAVETGRDGSYARVDLGPTRTDEGPWLVRVVPINDWGELGRPGAGIVLRDVRAPLLEFSAPFTSPVWPSEAELTGVAEPGTTVLVDGSGPLDLDRRGRFVIRETLLPWPRTFRLTATDASGNVTTSEVTVVGGVDYLQFPLEAILATVLIVAAVASGVFGSRRRRITGDGVGDVWDGQPDLGGFGGVGGSAGPGGDARRWLDDGPGPEIEDLPSRSGLGRH